MCIDRFPASRHGSSGSESGLWSRLMVLTKVKVGSRRVQDLEIDKKEVAEKLSGSFLSEWCSLVVPSTSAQVRVNSPPKFDAYQKIFPTVKVCMLPLAH